MIAMAENEIIAHIEGLTPEEMPAQREERFVWNPKENPPLAKAMKALEMPKETYAEFLIAQPRVIRHGKRIIVTERRAHHLAEQIHQTLNRHVTIGEIIEIVARDHGLQPPWDSWRDPDSGGWVVQETFTRQPPPHEYHNDPIF